MTWMTLVAVVVSTIFLFRYLIKFLQSWKYFHSLPGEKDFSLIYGSLHKWPGPNEEGKAYDFEQIKKNKYIHRVWVGPVTPLVLTFHPDSVRPVLKSSAPKPRYSFISSVYDMGLPWLGEGLLIANDSKWARNRRLLTPAFHYDILKKYLFVNNQCTSLMLKNIEAKCQKAESFDLFPLVEMVTLDVILRCACSYISDCQVKGDTTYTSALRELGWLWSDRSRVPYLFNDFIYNLTSHGKRFAYLCDVVHKVSEEIIEKRKKDLQVMSDQEIQGGVKDFLDIMLLARDEDGTGMSFQDIRNEVDTFLFEGHDTTTSGITWTMYTLAQHPEYQEKVYQEVCEVLGDREEVEWDDLGRLEYTTMCIKETLRLHTAVPFIERLLDEDIDIAGYKIPKGTNVAIQIWMLHHNPHVWDDPMTFDPERFHPDKQCEMDPFQFLPFSAGQRNCIGQNFAMNEMKVAISRAIRNFKFSLDPAHNVRQVLLPTLKTESGVMVFAEKRK